MWAIGNGESRSNIDLHSLPGPKVGCNAIFRDYSIEHIVCVDRRMVNEAIDARVNDHSLIYTRTEWFPRYKDNHKRIRLVPELPYVGSDRWDEPFQWGSGPYCVLLACKLTEDKQVNLLGFDLFSKTKTLNNLYKGTQNYDPMDKRPVDPKYWIKQISKLFDCYPKINFKIYQEENWPLPKEWKKTNVSLDKLSIL